jgi:IrrE N-terminal-like domain
MTLSQRVRQTRDLALARREAREIQSRHPSIFQIMPVQVSELANALGFAVEKRTELQQRARLEILREGGTERATIALRDGLDRNVGRFAVAHEIGHAVLLRKYPNTAREWDIDRREVFASTFAAEILASSEARQQIANSFRSLSDPLTLLRLASQKGLSPGALLTIAAQEESWTQGLDKIWMRIKYAENAFTRADPKLRVVGAYYDRSRFYVATNQSIVRLVGSEEWLASLPVGMIAEHSGSISIKFKQAPPIAPKFVARRVQAKLSAVRLHPSAAEGIPYLIAVADLAHKAEN